MLFPPSLMPLLLAVSFTESVAHEFNARGYLRLGKEDESLRTLKAVSSSLNAVVGQKEEEESYYWNRLMQGTDMSVAPTPAQPTPRPPTPEPPTSPSPTDEPTPSPVTPPPTPSPTPEPTPLPQTPPPSPAPTGAPTPIPGTSPPTLPPTPAGLTPVPSVAPTVSPVQPAPTEAPSTGEPPTTAPITTPSPTSAPTTPPPVTASPTTSPPSTPGPTPAVTPSPVTSPPTASPVVTPQPIAPSPVTPEPTPAAQTVPPTASPISPPPTVPTPTAPSPPTPQPVLPPSPTSGGTECAINLLVQCFSSDSEPCETAFPATLLCEGSTSSVSFKYNGGECDQSANMQISQCMDLQLFETGPDMESSVFIAVNDLMNNTLFSGDVAVGEVYSITPVSGAILPSLVTIRIFTDSTMETPLQRVSLSPSCTDTVNAPLFVMDIFGASQVIGWTNMVQGVVDATIPETLTFNYTITNTGPVDANMQSLDTTFVEGEFTFEQGVDLTDLVLPPGDALPPLLINVTGIMLDTGRRTFVINSNVTALNPSGDVCFDEDTSSFSFGYTLP